MLALVYYLVVKGVGSKRCSVDIYDCHANVLLEDFGTDLLLFLKVCDCGVSR